MQKLSPLSFLPLLFIFLCSCEKKDPYKEPEKLELPPITMEGKGTFGCKVNGQIWVPFVENPGLFHQKLEETIEPPGIGIQAILHRNNNEIWQNIYIDCVAVDTGSYQIPPPPFDGRVFINSTLTSSCSRYKVDTINSLIKILKLDFSQRIISGTFSYKDVVNDCGDTLQITEGRFDLRY
ncbi:MAG: hypothetical protein RLZZ546_1958 [Bacteroidota bacterium]|jgi:hypothetical protein